MTTNDIRNASANAILQIHENAGTLSAALKQALATVDAMDKRIKELEAALAKQEQVEKKAPGKK